jgi:hypothetical protein
MKITFLKRSIFITIILAMIFGFAFSLAQQILRQGADDPQIQIAQDSAGFLAAAQEPAFLHANTYGTVDLAKSLAPFLLTFDAEKKPMAFTATLNGQIPTPPAGVFAYVKAHGEDKITWQPAKGVRIALVAAYYKSPKAEGYVFSGRSLAGVEKHISSLQFMTFWAWVMTVIIAILGLLFPFLKNIISTRLAKLKQPAPQSKNDLP